MKNKEEVIKEKWIEIIGEENFKKLNVDENGFEDHYTYATKTQSVKEHTEKYFDINKNTGLIRPKSLQGIESNNGWISINSEKDLPAIGTFYTILSFDENIVEREFPHPKFTLEFNKEWWLKYVTHYQEKIMPNKPLHK